MNRRGFIKTLTALASTAAIPFKPLVAVAASASSPTVPLSWFAVGTDSGEFDWNSIQAFDLETALQIYAEERDMLVKYDGDCACFEAGKSECDGSCGRDPNEPCSSIEGFAPKTWQGRERIKNANWLDADMGTLCDRCGYECFRDDGAHSVADDEAVCGECMTLEDWRICDPDAYTEKVAEMWLDDDEAAEVYIATIADPAERARLTGLRDAG